MCGIGFARMPEDDGSLADGTAPATAPAEIGHEPTIGKIERVPLREVWRHEAYNLTTWLEEKHRRSERRA
ncbi:MAG: hypothetical protein WBP81_03720 [Solirubrobacteraceae bacterium]